MQGADGSVYVAEIQGGTPTIVYDKNGESPEPEMIPPFTLAFFKDGSDNIANKVSRVKWTIPEDNCALSILDGDNKTQKITVQVDTENSLDNPHSISVSVDPKWSSKKYNNYITAEISYGKYTFKETYPISIVKNGNDGDNGLTIITRPNSYVLKANDANELSEDISILINFDIFRGNEKESDFSVSDNNGVRGLIPNIVELAPEDGSYDPTTQVKLVFRAGQVSLPENGEVEIDLVMEGQIYTQTFVYSKVKGGDSPYLLFVQSTNGTIFKDNEPNTILVATVMKGTIDVTNDILLQNPGAFIWKKYDKSGIEDTSWTIEYNNDKMNEVVIDLEDFEDDKATFSCLLNL